MRYGNGRTQTLYRDVGERIMLARRRLRLTQRELAERIGISHVALGDIERAKSRPDLDNLAVIADALGVPLSQLTGIPPGRAPSAPTPSAGQEEA